MRFIRITALLALFSIPAFAEINVRDGKITANFTSQPLSQAIQTIKQQSGIQINVDENVANETVSANFKDVPLAIGIKKLLEGTGINYAVIAGADGVPSAVLISGSEKPGAPPKKLDTRPVVAGPPQNRSVVTPVAPMPPPVTPAPTQAPTAGNPNTGMKPAAGGVAPVGAPNANQQPTAINPTLKFDPNNIPTAGSLVPTVNTPQAQPQPQPNVGTVVGTDEDEDDE